MRKTKSPIPGFGHPQHSEGDPRANVLLALTKQRGLTGPYLGMLQTVKDVLPEALGRPLPININGVIPAILLEIGFPLTALKSISILARTAGPACASSGRGATAHRLHHVECGGRRDHL